MRFGPAMVLVPTAVQSEMGGLTNRPGIAAEIARLSGGRVHAEGAPAAGGGRAAVYATFLAAAACVVWGARRRRAA